jgi:hypothetical protein
MDMQAA